MSKYSKLFLFALVVFPFLLAVGNVFQGRMAFWFDPARDLTLAIQNLHHPTLIGQPSGIPHIFYGPYWIWLISLVLIFSRDPRLVVFFILTIPYFTIFPFVLYKFTKQFGVLVFGSLWFLFIINFIGYSDQLWNTHLGPLFFLLTLFFLFKTSTVEKKRFLYVGLSGISSGLTANFHLSLGISVFAGSMVFLILNSIWEFRAEKQSKRSIIHLALTPLMFLMFFMAIFAPFVLFEIRHGFLQTKSFLFAVENSIVYDSAVVGQTGLDYFGRVATFFQRFGTLLNINISLGYISLFALSVEILIKWWKKKMKFTRDEKKILLLLITISSVIIATYLATRNPVWDYYYIGVEIIFVLFLAVFFKKTFVAPAVVIVALILTINPAIKLIGQSISHNANNTSDLSSEEQVVDSVYKDSGNNQFYYYAYSPEIYTYDYDYLFKYSSSESEKNKLDSNSNTVYLIIPSVSSGVRTDFIHYKTPDANYKTLKTWYSPNGTLVIKRRKI